MEKPRRSHGFQFPLHPLQLLTFLHLLSSMAINYYYYEPIHISIYSFFLIVTMVGGIVLTLKEPPTVRSSRPTIECMICGRVPEESMHCKYCNKCVPRLDHHCFYVNTCIASHNYSMYIITLVSTISLSLTSITWLTIKITMDRSIPFLICYGVEVVKNSGVVCFLGYLCVFHGYLCVTKQTTLEYSKSRKVHVGDIDT
jgi:hypothetical protein